MNSKKTWAWILLATALFGIIWLERIFTSKPVVGPHPVLAGFKAGAVTTIQVAPAGQREIRAERTNAGWQLVKPVVYPAQSGSISNLLIALERLEVAILLTGADLRQHPNGDAEFGFTAPQFVLTVHDRDTHRPIKIGAPTAPGNQVYVQVVGGEGVYVVDAEWLKLIPRQADDWRDRTVVDVPALAYDRVTISNAAGPFELQRSSTNTLWTMRSPLPARADNDRFAVLLHRLHSLGVDRFVTDDPKADLPQFGLQPPALQIGLAQGTNRLVRLDLGSTVGTNAGLIYARRADKDSIFTVSTNLLTQWYEASEQFRDHRLIAFPRPIDQIEVRGSNPFTVRRQANDVWRIDGEEVAVDTFSVNQFLNTIGNLQILQFKDAITESDLPQLGLAPPLRQLVFRSNITNSWGPTNLVLADLSFGVTNGTVYVRRSDENPVYAVKPADFQKLPAAAWQLRESRIWDFSVSDVTRLTIRQDGKTRRLLHTGTNAWMLLEGSQGVVNEFAVEEAVFRFGGLNAESWVQRGAQDLAPFGIGTNGVSLVFELKNGQKREVQTSTAMAEPAYGAVQLEGQTWIFELPFRLRDPLYHLQIPANVP